MLQKLPPTENGLSTKYFYICYLKQFLIETRQQMYSLGQMAKTGKKFLDARG